jgi:hypothetical protein
LISAMTNRHRAGDCLYVNLVVMAVVGCTPLATKVWQVERQKRAVTWTVKKGGEVTYDYEFEFNVLSNTRFSRWWDLVIVSGPRSVSRVPRCIRSESVRYLQG